MAVAFTEGAFPDPILLSRPVDINLLFSLFFLPPTLAFPLPPSSSRLRVPTLSLLPLIISHTPSQQQLSFVAMIRILCITSLALAAVSAVSGHVIRHRRGAPQGWQSSILQVHSLLVVYVISSFSLSLAVLSGIPRPIPVVGLPE